MRRRRPVTPLTKDLVGQSVWLLRITTRHDIATITAHTDEESAYSYLRGYTCDLLATEGFGETDETVMAYFRQEGGTWSVDEATIVN